MVRMVVIVVAMVVMTARAAADEVPPTWMPDPPALKSPTAAVLLSAGIPAAGIASLVLAGKQEFHEPNQAPFLFVLGCASIAAIAVGPTAGHIYAHDTWNTGLKIRLLGVATLALGVLGATTTSQQQSDGTGGPGAVVVPIVVALLPLSVGALWEIATAGSAVQDYNRRLTRPQLSIAPMSHGAGLALAAAF